MLERLKKYFEGRNILILGFGIEGQSTYRLLRRINPEASIHIADKNSGILQYSQLRQDKEKISVSLGLGYMDQLGSYDMIIKSPGIPYSSIPALSAGKVTSQTEIFMSLFRDQIIGITGTKGKSTTSSLIYHIISAYSKNTLLAGNIGTPPFDLVDDVSSETCIVYEMSSHQLEQTSVSPHIAVFLNLFEEHLDHYRSFKYYAAAKLRITANQHPNDFLIYNADDERLKKYLSRSRKAAVEIPVSLLKMSETGWYADDENIYCMQQRLIPVNQTGKLPGRHNLYNIMAALAVCRLKGVPAEFSAEGLLTFNPLRHRIEYVGEYHGIRFYNDSIATIPEAAIAAVETLKDVDTIIVGGYDRGIDYRDFAVFLLKSSIKNVIFLGEAGQRIRILLQGMDYKEKKLFSPGNLSDAMDYAKEYTMKGKICLLSPAAASYGMFKNFAERGDAFCKLAAQ